MPSYEPEDKIDTDTSPQEDRRPKQIPIKWPESAEDLKAPPPNQLNRQCEDLTRDHFPEVSDYWKEAEKGKGSTHGSFDMTQAALAFWTKQLATANGYSAIAAANEQDILIGMRRAFTKVAGIRPIDLKKNAIALNFDLRLRLSKQTPQT